MLNKAIVSVCAAFGKEVETAPGREGSGRSEPWGGKQTPIPSDTINLFNSAWRFNNNKHHYYGTRCLSKVWYI